MPIADGQAGCVKPDFEAVAEADERIACEALSALDALKTSCERSIKAIENNNDDRLAVNSLGVVQGRGSDVDRLCGIYTTLFEVRENVAFHIQQATK